MRTSLGSIFQSPSFLGLVVIGIIIAIAFAAYYYLEEQNENELRSALLEETKVRQIETTGSLGTHISSDIDSVITKLQLLASQSTIQRGELASDRTTQLLKQSDANIRETTFINSIAVLDANNIHVNNSLEELRSFIGVDRSDTEFVIETRKTLRPYISSGFTGVSGMFGISVSVPIINQESDKYIGILVVGLPTIEFFERYGNVLDVDSASIVALDKNGAIISTGIPELLAQDFFGETVQEFSGRNEEINALYRNVMSGNPDSALFTATLGERFSVGYPVRVNGEQIMSIFVTTPTASIYAKVDEGLAIGRLQVSALLVAISLAIIALVIFILKWSGTLNIRVREQTAELRAANDQLLQHDKMQKEFINIAAHELRTPVQPLIGIADILEQDFQKTGKIELGRAEFEMLKRNARRLERLSSDILQVSRIESRSLTLNKEAVNLREKISNVIADIQSTISKASDVKIVVEPFEQDLTVMADKAKLFEVLSNLLRNALKFTTNGAITISVHKDKLEDLDFVVVSIKDTGTGIDEQVIPKLFAKFVSKSEQGTGLGLFISKSIVEAHGGKIWAENNRTGNGATFTFTLPIDADYTLTPVDQPRKEA